MLDLNFRIANQWSVGLCAYMSMVESRLLLWKVLNMHELSLVMFFHVDMGHVWTILGHVFSILPWLD